MKKSVLLLAFLAVGGTILAGEKEDETVTLMRYICQYRKAQSAVQDAAHNLKQAEMSDRTNREIELPRAYKAYEQASMEQERLIRLCPLLTYYVCSQACSTIIERACTPDGITSFSPSYRASSPDVPTR